MITFHFANTTLGGAPSLIIRVVTELFKKGIICKILTFKGNFIDIELQKNKVEFVLLDLYKYPQEKEDLQLDEKDIIVCIEFSTYLINLCKKNPFVIVYNIFPDQVSRANKYKFKTNFTNLTKRLIKLLVQKQGLVFMDGEGPKEIKHSLKLDISSPQYLAIPIHSPQQNLYKKNFQVFNSSSCLRLTYVGRSEIWKMIPVKKIIEDLRYCGLNQKIVLHIVSDDIKFTKNYLQVENQENLEIKFYEKLNPSQLTEFLLQNSDLHFAMGTSCLEGASLGIPSLLVDGSFDEFPSVYRYRWLFETEDFILGRIINKDSIIQEGLLMQQVISKMRDENFVSSISDKCYGYVQQNHSIQKQADRLAQLCYNTNVKMQDVKKFIVYYTSIHQFFFKFKKGN